MRLHTLTPAKGSTKNRKRVGRGQGSGRGGTSTRGHKGAQSRSGYSRKVGFEGGQMPLQRRVPKFGFKNNNKVVYKPINLDSLVALSEKVGNDITLSHFVDNGLASKNDKVKVLANGEISVSIKVEAHKFSKSAADAIEKAGGSISQIES